MKYLGQMTIIMLITLLGEVLNKILPLTIPGSIYGFLIMLLLLQTKILKLDQVKDVGDFLLNIMPIMFVPALVGTIVLWEELSQNIIGIMITAIVTTVIVMVITGKSTEFVLKRGTKDAGNND